MNLLNLNCPCGSEKLYSLCCEIAHLNIGTVESAEQLMRSRYVAFTKGMGDYLMASHHSSTRTISEKDAIVNWSKSVKWDRLEIVSKEDGLVNDESGIVEFKSYFYEGRTLECMHEKSLFVKENDVWMYYGCLE